MQDLIQKLVNDYNTDKITWYDIQDIVEGHSYSELDEISDELM